MVNHCGVQGTRHGIGKITFLTAYSAEHEHGMDTPLKKLNAYKWLRVAKARNCMGFAALAERV